MTTPTEAVARGSRWIPLIVIGALVLAGIFVGGWKLHWWLAGQSANNNYKITQQGVSNQDTLRDQITKNFATLLQEDVSIAQAQAAHDPGLVGQEKVEATAQAGTLCQEGSEVNTVVGYPADIQQWFSTNCTLGVVSPTSQYYIPMG